MLNHGINNSRRLSTKDRAKRLTGALVGPTPRLADLCVRLSFLCWFSTALKIASTPFIQVGLIRESRIDAIPYIYSLVPPPQRHLGNPNSYLWSRSRHMRRNRSRTSQCSRLVAREWGSSWAHAQVPDLVSAKPCIFTSTSCKTYYQFIIFLSTWLCLLWIYILLSYGYHYFYVRVHRSLSLLVYQLG